MNNEYGNGAAPPEINVSAAFGDDFKEQVRAATNIVEIVAETVPLTPVRNGTDYVGLCPFHEDRNPSFHVYPDRQTYRCWVCNVGGDCFRWLMEIEKLSFPEAIELLAKRANIEIPKKNRSEFADRVEDNKSTQYEIVEWAISLMQQGLRTGPAGEPARTYAQQRGLNEETLRKFRLGYHPEDWSWLLNKAKGRFSEKQLVSVGLAGERDNGRGFYDNLVGRLVFPIIDERGRPVAFGGRVLPGEQHRKSGEILE
ncbi:MAG: CHC2 zinc finger domain-containing protein [Planctomycetaceae bacterium]